MTSIHLELLPAITIAAWEEPKSLELGNIIQRQDRYHKLGANPFN